MENSKVRVAILEDHQSIIDGYVYRLSASQHVVVTGTATFGEQLGPLLAEHPADVLLLDIYVPSSRTNHNSFPILHIIPGLLKEHPQLRILVISMLNQPTLIDALVAAGVRGYIFKDDQASIQKLANIVVAVAKGEGYFSPGAAPVKKLKKPEQVGSPLTARQLQVLSVCAAYPDITTGELAARLGIASSTLRNLLSGAYLRLDVRTRAAAIIKVRQMGLLAEIGVSLPEQDS